VAGNKGTLKTRAGGDPDLDVESGRVLARDQGLEDIHDYRISK
jgi:hypothetical protein